MSNFVATDVYALFNIHDKKSTTLLCKNKGGWGGGQGPFTQCVKKHSIWNPGASLSMTVLQGKYDTMALVSVWQADGVGIRYVTVSIALWLLYHQSTIVMLVMHCSVGIRYGRGR